MSKKIDLPIEDVKNMYLLEYKTTKQIADVFNTDRTVIANALKRHGVAIRSSNDPIYIGRRASEAKPCQIDGCTSLAKKSGLCKRHHLQKWRHGDVLERTRYDRNEYINHGTFLEVFVYNSKSEVCGKFKIDSHNAHLIEQYKWQMDSSGYIVTGANSKNQDKKSLHRIILGLKDDDIRLGDHINLDKSDNREENLRIVNKSKNEYNKKIDKSNTTGVKGVCPSKYGYQAELKNTNNGVEKRFSKKFKTFDDAVKQRLFWESKLCGEYSYNFNPTTQTLQLTYLSHDDNKQTYLEVSLDGTILQFNKL